MTPYNQVVLYLLLRLFGVAETMVSITTVSNIIRSEVRFAMGAKLIRLV